MQFALRALTAFSLTALLWACGGDSGGGDSNRPDIKAATPTDSPVPKALAGKWNFSVTQKDGVTARDSLEFQKGLLTLTRVCDYKGETFTVAAQSPVKYSDKAIEVLSEASNSRSTASVRCSISLNQGTIPYAIQGGTLVLGESEDLMLTR